jgi:hypothetical protein
LDLSLRVEKRKGSEINSSIWIRGVDCNGIGCSSCFAIVADTNIAEKILSVLQVGFLLGTAKALPSCGSILLTAIVTALLSKSTSILGLPFGDTLSLCLLVCFLCCFLFGFLFCGYLGLFPLDFRIFRGIPAV